MNKHIILGVHITDRLRKVAEVQQLFSQYGCNIKTRLGLHEAAKDVCSPNGLVLLEMVGDEKHCLSIIDKLSAIKGVYA
ncbi:MAG TPA: hypothetical protein PKO36_14950, partial [Candidatus Hydrogenedentes bacterium]|nr:hypothetical protein [Candidatus Hydrogenedentota bacterium]